MRISDWSSDVCSSDLDTHGCSLTAASVWLEKIRHTGQADSTWLSSSSCNPRHPRRLRANHRDCLRSGCVRDPRYLNTPDPQRNRPNPEIAPFFGTNFDPILGFISIQSSRFKDRKSVV